MTSNLGKYKADLGKLVTRGKRMEVDLSVRAVEQDGELDAKWEDTKKKVAGSFEKDYQRWYTEAHVVLRQLIPDRLQEFESLYKGEGRRKAVDSTTFTIQDWMTGVRSSADYTGKKYFSDLAIVSMKLQTQLAILSSAESRFDSSLFHIRQVVQADLFDTVLDAARELLKNGFHRGAGAVAGVVEVPELIEGVEKTTKTLY